MDEVMRCGRGDESCIRVYVCDRSSGGPKKWGDLRKKGEGGGKKRGVA